MWLKASLLLALVAIATGQFEGDDSGGQGFLTEQEINEGNVDGLEETRICPEVFDESQCKKCEDIDADFEKGRCNQYVSCTCVRDSRGIFEGDMRVSIKTRPVISAMYGLQGGAQSRGLTNNEDFIWPDPGRIPFVIEGLTSNHRNKINEAMEEFQRKTCIGFVQRSVENDYIRFAQTSRGCYSYVGRIGDGQLLNLGPNCAHTGVIVHEIMHALGFYHEQSRPDREKYITIVEKNIAPARKSNFRKLEPDQIDSMGSPYDLRSIMHYGEYAFSANREKTILVKNSNVRIGQRDGLSDEDINQIKRKYCSGTGVATTRPTTTQRTTTTTRKPATTTPGSCRNLQSDGNCEFWKKSGYCIRTFVSYMSLNCKKSCGKCIGKGSDDCEDARGSVCGIYKKYCEGSIYTPWMKTNCKKTCGLCPNSEATTTTSTRSADATLPTVSVTSNECGRATYDDPTHARIIGGVEARQGQFPWQVSIRNKYGAPVCGASLIAKEWLLTAAHCVKPERKSTYKFYLGVHERYPKEGKYVSRTASKIIIHPRYDNRFMYNDIALIKLSEPVSYTNFMRPVCLADTDPILPATVTVSGWGRVGQDEIGNNKVLLKVDLPLQPNRVCNRWIKAKHPRLEVTDDMMCAGAEQGGKDSCQGDSGGPLTYRAYASKTNILVGVVSWGMGCAQPKQPGVYTRVSHYREWIQKHAGV